MIEMKFYRDNEYVYINNTDGTTKKVPIDVFESAFDVDYLYPITVIYNEQSSSYTVDKTYAEILSAMDSGKFCIGIGDISPYLVGRYFDSGVTYIQFYSFHMVLPGTASDAISMSGFQLSPDGTITDFYKTVD